ncbi:MarR family transcriptional regulator [Streptosporangiaceae bacterium NEAU-GS5]|nr:MarR family transcriptional regulator [Streptosporangiaceae bacterium NEAU-GS5]
MADRAELIDQWQRQQRMSIMRAFTLHTAIAERVGLNITDFTCVNALSLLGPMTPGELAEVTGLTKGGAITAVIDRLERAGFAHRRRDDHDRRKVIVELDQEKTLAEIAPMFGRLAGGLTEALSKLSEEDLRMLLGLTATVNEVSRAAAAALKAERPPG